MGVPLAISLPKVSVIIPNYNMHRFLPAAVRSVTKQTYANIELLIVDDGSSEKLNRDRLVINGLEPKLLEVEHGGKSAAVNYGFREANGKYLVILDADDRLPGGSVQQRVELLEKGNADLCIGSFEVSHQGAIVARRAVSKIAGRSNEAIIRTLLTRIVSPFHQNAMLFSRKLLGRTGGMNPKMLRGQDLDFAIRLLQQSQKTLFIKESVYIYNRYKRPIAKRLYNRCMGMKFKQIVILQYIKGWRKAVYVFWSAMVETAKLIHDLFGVYKR